MNSNNDLGALRDWIDSLASDLQAANVSINSQSTPQDNAKAIELDHIHKEAEKLRQIWSRFTTSSGNNGYSSTGMNAADGILSFYKKDQKELMDLLKGTGRLPMQFRADFGKYVNAARDEIKALITESETLLTNAKIEAEASASTVDPTLPGTRTEMGHLHPLTLVRDDTIDFFRGMGFELAEAREVDHEWYNFEALNIPPDHPARDMHDTFYVDDGVVLRTHTSNVQVHYLLGREPGPVRMLAPGCVYRVDNDASHAPMFQQVECLVIDENISFSHLKGVMLLWAEHVFGKGTQLRVRPSYFPFTEPSAEVDVSCSLCGGKGCRLCKQTGWIEVGGCGSVDPAVLTQVGWDPERWTGFAFGFGIDRIALLKYGIPNIGLLTKNEIGFLKQF